MFYLETLLDCLLALRTLVAGLAAAAAVDEGDGAAILCGRVAAVAAGLDRAMRGVLLGPPAAVTSTAPPLTVTSATTTSATHHQYQHHATCNSITNTTSTSTTTHRHRHRRRHRHDDDAGHL